MIEHMSACKQKYEDQADSSPQVAILDDWDNIRPGNTQERDSSEKTGYNGNPKAPINRTYNLRMRSAV